MTRTLFLLAALAAAPAVSAQQTPTTPQTTDRVEPGYQMNNQADLDRLGQDLDYLDQTMTGDMRGDYTTYRESYDQLRQATPSTDMTDPEAARQARTDYGTRYDELSGNVYRARLSSARDRNDYIEAANGRVGTYDNQIQAMRTRYDAATGTARSDMARDMIRLRRQRDAYRNQVYSMRGMTRSDFDAARQRATDTLTRSDADFSRVRREAMMRGVSGTGNGTAPTVPERVGGSSM